ncbi:uncharacterized protein LOC125232487 [Leguminivora glycinivorella]|uniref:uncharacterized protein LOC125232487 n=1 Tax=Leguminivora glycinivorella TaxID=1035111 RepID=UPI00200CD1C4|nr:uncharacterized protein LOC125232487 [Leguminivora glycinivorella]
MLKFRPTSECVGESNMYERMYKSAAASFDYCCHVTESIIKIAAVGHGILSQRPLLPCTGSTYYRTARSIDYRCLATESPSQDDCCIAQRLFYYTAPGLQTTAALSQSRPSRPLLPCTGSQRLLLPCHRVVRQDRCCPAQSLKDCCCLVKESPFKAAAALHRVSKTAAALSQSRPSRLLLPCTGSQRLLLPCHRVALQDRCCPAQGLKDCCCLVTESSFKTAAARHRVSKTAAALSQSRPSRPLLPRSHSVFNLLLLPNLLPCHNPFKIDHRIKRLLLPCTTYIMLTTYTDV